MIEIFCRKCHGTGGKEYDYELETVVKCCENCNGKGYTEHDGSLEDLELAQAVKMAFEQKFFLAYENDYGDITDSIFKNELINWYREQKGDK